MTKLSPIESEFETTENAEAYDKWFRAKVQKALDSKEPLIPHDEAMAEIKRRMELRRARGPLDG
ncbi:MAG: type II toxin-antitoxin system RelB family antitoxin [Sphingomonas sp.]|uniref:type II toxin-antitoxin system RelB family antitoxin n=1 Tax=Sphingomonas sp. TaxID=28214 RepID=UPI003F7D3E5A